MPNNSYDACHKVGDIHGVTITEWPNRPQDRRYTVLHPPCGVNILPRRTIQAARQAAETHARKCRAGRR
jgi:hypothetical protein